MPISLLGLLALGHCAAFADRNPPAQSLVHWRLMFLAMVAPNLTLIVMSLRYAEQPEAAPVSPSQVAGDVLASFRHKVCVGVAAIGMMCALPALTGQSHPVAEVAG